jgi:hypothetical protein
MLALIAFRFLADKGPFESLAHGFGVHMHPQPIRAQ